MKTSQVQQHALKIKKPTMYMLELHNLATSQISETVTKQISKCECVKRREHLGDVCFPSRPRAPRTSSRHPGLCKTLMSPSLACSIQYTCRAIFLHIVAVRDGPTCAAHLLFSATVQVHVVEKVSPRLCADVDIEHCPLLMVPRRSANGELP